MKGQFQKIFAIDLSGKHSCGIKIGHSDREPMKEPTPLVHNLFDNNITSNKQKAYLYIVKAFKLGLYEQGNHKIVFLT